MKRAVLSSATCQGHGYRAPPATTSGCETTPPPGMLAVDARLRSPPHRQQEGGQQQESTECQPHSSLGQAARRRHLPVRPTRWRRKPDSNSRSRPRYGPGNGSILCGVSAERVPMRGSDVDLRLPAPPASPLGMSHGSSICGLRIAPFRGAVRRG
jgi:hypothetical protein